MDELLQAVVLEHSRRPRHFAKLASPPARHFKAVNPLCGDEVEVYAEIKDGVFTALSFDGAGCAVSQAAASLVVSQCQSQSLEKVGQWAEDFAVAFAQGFESPGARPLPLELALLLPIGAYPRRVPCVLCVWEALRKFLAFLGTLSPLSPSSA